MVKRSLMQFLCATYVNVRAVCLWCSGSIIFLLLSFIASIFFLFFSYRRLRLFRVIISRIVLIFFGVICDFDDCCQGRSDEGVILLSNYQSM